MENRRRFQSYITQNSPNPCGRECIPFNDEYCSLKETDLPPVDKLESVAVRITDKYALQTVANAMCRLLEETRELTYQLHMVADDARFNKSIAEKVAKDKITGLYSGNGLEAILDEIYKPENIRNLIHNNYHALIVYVDVNDLRLHNSGPGGHAQGDMAIATVGERIKKFSKSDRRSEKVITPRDDIDEYDRRIEMKIPRVIASRSNERGDEFLIMSLNPFCDPDKMLQTKEKLSRLFGSMEYEYEGKTYPVSVTFGISEAPLPVKIEDLKELIKNVDVEMMKHKNKNKKLKSTVSSGVAVYL